MITLFHKKQQFEVVAPITGECISLAEVNDEVFAKRMMGEGFAVRPAPKANLVVAPIAGEVVALPDSHHAVGIKAAHKSLEVLIHIGLNTVALAGTGFTALIKKGDKVNVGTPLIRFDEKLMAQKKIDMSTMVIFTNGYSQPLKLGTLEHSSVTAAQPLLRE